MRSANDFWCSRRMMHSALACGLALSIAACNKTDTGSADQPATASAGSQVQASESAPMEWARSALAKNPHVELVATDTKAQVFTIRDKQTGEVSAVKLNDLAAAPVSQLLTTRSSNLPEQEGARIAAATPSQPASLPSSGTSEPATESSSSPSAKDSSGGAYTIERNEGQVRVTGPGVSIVSSDSGAKPGGEGTAANTVDPIICEGRRMVHFDNREISVEGNAITVRGGCELYITNSRIVATGTGIVVQDGIVHVSNSHIEGQEGSFDADSRAKVFVRSSTFRGLPRRSELALVQDQGGNRWR
jgi:hypothetical protein